MVSRTDEETMRFLDDVIQLCVLVNPDGMDLVSDWYMKHGNMNMPVLYNQYAGHDDNRDFYMAALAGVARTSTASCTASGSRRSCTTITRPVRPAR